MGNRPNLALALEGFDDDVRLSTRASPSQRRWIVVRRRFATAAVAGAVILFLGAAIAHRASAPRFDRGGIVVGTLDPFASVSAADVYLVPLDRPAWNADGSFSLRQFAVACRCAQEVHEFLPDPAVGN